MENVIKLFRTFKNIQTETIDSGQEIINEIRDVSKQLICTDNWFQMESDGDLIEACIYQREVLNARYRYLMKKAKCDNINSSPFEHKCISGR